MSHVENRGTKAKPRYVAVWRTPDGRPHAKSFTRKIDADRYLTSVDASLLARTWIDPDAGRQPLGEFVTQWVDAHPVRATTRDRYRANVKNLGVLEGVPIGRLTPSMVRAWQADLLTRLAASTVGTVRMPVQAALRSAVRDRLIASDPFAGVKPPAVERKLVTPFTVETVRDIASSIAPWYRAAVLVGAGAGLRRGETFGLTVDRVDFLRRRVTVDQQLVRVSGRGLVLGPPKTPASYRIVPLPDFVLEALAYHLDTFPHTDGLIFETRGGKPVDAGVLADAWRRVAPAGSRFHDLRHFYASTLIEDGSSVKVVQARLGHATAKETLDTYGHLWPDSEDNTRRTMDAAFAVETLIVKPSTDRFTELNTD